MQRAECSRIFRHAASTILGATAACWSRSRFSSQRIRSSLLLRECPVYHWFAADITAHPWRWLVGVALATVAAAVGISQLQFDDDPRSLYMGDDAASQQLQTFYEEFGADDQDILLVLRAADIFAPDVLNAGRDLWLAAAEVRASSVCSASTVCGDGGAA